MLQKCFACILLCAVLCAGAQDFSQLKVPPGTRQLQVSKTGPDGKKQGLEIYRYNAGGLLVEITLTDRKKKPLRQQRFDYDSLGRPVRELLKSSQPTDSIRQRMRTMTYKGVYRVKTTDTLVYASGQLAVHTDSVFYSRQGVPLVEVNTIVRDGKNITTTVKWKLGQGRGQTTAQTYDNRQKRVYDASARLTEHIIYDGQMRKQHEEMTEYDSLGNLRSKITRVFTYADVLQLQLSLVYFNEKGFVEQYMQQAAGAVVSPALVYNYRPQFNRDGWLQNLQEEITGTDGQQTKGRQFVFVYR